MARLDETTSGELARSTDRDRRAATIERTLPWRLVSYAQYRVLADWTRGIGYHKKRADMLAKAIDEFATKWLEEH